MRYTLGFIGAGNMAEAIARAAVGAGVVPADRVVAFDPSDGRRKVFADLGIAVAPDNATVIRDSEQVLLAVKPQSLPQISAELATHVAEHHVLISIMAGISSARLAQAVGRPVRVVRVMPNTPLMVGHGMSAIARGPDAREGDEALAVKLFSAAGKAVVVEESKMDAVTAVSGSGPAYLFYLAEAMERAAADLGLGAQARLLVQQTLLGAAELLTISSDPPAELRRKVTSPGGTTEAAVKHLDARAAAAAIVEAIKAAQKRAEELGA